MLTSSLGQRGCPRGTRDYMIQRDFYDFLVPGKWQCVIFYPSWTAALGMMTRFSAGNTLPWPLSKEDIPKFQHFLSLHCHSSIFFKWTMSDNYAGLQFSIITINTQRLQHWLCHTAFSPQVLVFQTPTKYQDIKFLPYYSTPSCWEKAICYIAE